MIVCRLLIAAALLLGTGVHSCSPVDGWEQKPLEERARHPKLVVYGTVLTDEAPAMRGNFSGDQDSAYTLKPDCWFKSDPNVTFANITVVEQIFDCTSVTLKKGNKYIIFLTEFNTLYGGYIIDDVNVQSGTTEEPTKQDFEAVYRGIDAGMDGMPDGKCVDGVDIPCFVGDIDEEVCNHGVVVKAAMLYLVMTSLVAKFFF